MSELIVFEGLNGAGKSSLIHALQARQRGCARIRALPDKPPYRLI